MRARLPRWQRRIRAAPPRARRWLIPRQRPFRQRRFHLRNDAMARQVGGFRANLEYLPVAVLVRMFAAMPLERALKVGASLGSIVMRLDVGNRPIGVKNLEIAFPELAAGARLKILAGMYRNWGRIIAEWPHSSALNRDNIERFVTYDGVENLREALRLAEKRGAIIL